MKYYLIVGEASGDLHASHLMKELKARDAEADFRFLGGDLMKAQGGTLVYSRVAPFAHDTAQYEGVQTGRVGMESRCVDSGGLSRFQLVCGGIRACA